ncbi:MAG: sugar transferase, partial [Pseudomonadota bacterium]
ARHAKVPQYRILTVLAPTAEEMARSQTVIEMLNAAALPYSVVLPFDGLARDGLNLQKVVGADMVMAEMERGSPKTLGRGLKRLFDFAAAGVITVMLAPLLVAVAALLSLERGPVLFSQLRVGRKGRLFRCYKFRTMRPDAEAVLQQLLTEDPAARAEWTTYQKLRNDPRITPIGNFLRKTSLDELPQLLNVLKGDMSLVGPRPIVAPDVPGYPSDLAYFESSEIAYYMRCTPGITGLWQVSGRNATTHDERIRLDRWYARNWSFWLDIVILFKTVRVVLMGRGSA